jgi:predicted PurR-regulated permease PerM
MSLPTPPLRRPRSQAERLATHWLKILLLIVLGATILSAVFDFFGRVRSFTIIMIGAIFFTYVVFPMVRVLARRMPAIVAILIVYAGLAVVAALAFAFLVPALANDAQALVKAYPGIVRNAQAYINDPANPVRAHLPPGAREYLSGLPLQLGALAQQYAGGAAAGVLTILLSTVALIATVVVIPVISAYLMLENEALTARAMSAIPPAARPKVTAIVHDFDVLLGGFIRGQFLVGAIVGALITLALLVTHVKYAVLIGVVAGLLNIIPFVGAIVGFVPAVLLALFNDGWQQALIVAACFVGINQLEGHVIAPRVVSESVGLSPLMVIVAILIGGELGGLGGMFLAVPVAGVLRVLAAHLIPRYPLPGDQALAEIPAPVPPAPAPREPAAQGGRR